MPSGSGVEVSGETGLRILREILSEQLNPSAMPKINFSEEWHNKYLQEIDQFVENHFPKLPTERLQGSQEGQIQDFLKRTQNMIYDEVLRLTPALKDAGLLDHLKDSYSRHIFTNLDLLLNRDLSVKELFCLIVWGKDLFFSSESKLTVYDPLLLTGEFERAKQKLLQNLQIEMSTRLQCIFENEKKHVHNVDSIKEETFNSIHIDVIQILDYAIRDAKKAGQTLMHAVQILCCGELRSFVQKFVDAENERLKQVKITEKNSVHLFWIIKTCIQLRCYAEQITPDINNSDVYTSTIFMLQKLEGDASASVQKIMNSLAQENLESYFKKRNRHIDILMEAIQMQCACLPETASEIKTVVVKIAYNSVSKVYLECLMKTKFRNLEQCWENAEEKIKEDVQYFHETFSELNDIAAQNQLLQKMSKVLHYSDVDALKITCCELFKDFPQESEQFVPGLLRWKGVLSRQQIEMSTRLQCIFENEKKHVHNVDSITEETFNSIHIDVIQNLHYAILDAEKVGQTLIHAVQILCCGELRSFVQKYVDAEKEHLNKVKFTEKNFKHLFRIINTCMRLRYYAAQISPDKNNSDVYLSTICMLQNLEDGASSTVQNIMNGLAQENLVSHFKKRNRHIDILMEAIQTQCACLPETASEVKTVVVKIAYNSVSKVYLECLMKTKNLEECWGNAMEKIKEVFNIFMKHSLNW
ncbi:exocyst complex component 3-like protein [Labeo rohita]|uniref:Exocyst complex component 3-like protein n=1 Tax=Labeo rohita TaxID=84645 RepID=A0A498N2Q6_LABRO|nr:exocyst complex component 3-like protein [Labeo rohita]